MSKKLKNLIVEIEALHNEMTGNYLLYTEEALADFETWLSPYRKPAILHHKDEDGEIVGRVLDAKKIPSNLKEGLYALWLKARITAPHMIEGIKNGTYVTTSVGVRGTHVECSVCGHRLDGGYLCGHKKGKIYKGQRCHWIVKKMVAKEISFVIIPSDKYSQVVKFYEEEEENQKEEVKDMELQEALVKIAELEAKNASLEADNTLSQTALREAKEDLASEMSLREGLETELNTIKLAEKAADIDAILALREKLGLRELARETLEVKDGVLLKESLADLEEELNFKESQDQKGTDIMHLKEAEQLKNNELEMHKKTEYKASNVKSIMDDLL